MKRSKAIVSSSQARNGTRKPFSSPSEWLTPEERIQLTEKGYFEVVGGTTGKRYRIFPSTSMNVVERDESGREFSGLCFLPLGNLPVGDTMLAQKVAIATTESAVRTIAAQNRSSRTRGERLERCMGRLVPGCAGVRENGPRTGGNIVAPGGHASVSELP